MRRTWTTMSMLLWACGGGQAPQPVTAAEVRDVEQAQGDAVVEAPQAAENAPAATPASAPASAPAKTASAPAAAAPAASAAGGCAPVSSEPKLVAGDSSVSDSADTGRALIFDVAGIALELPACTPDADVRVITVSWETKDRPSAARIDPNFTRHAATLRVDQSITAAEGNPLVVRLRSKRELAKPGEKLVLAVESSVECTDKNKKDKLEDGDCSGWQLYDVAFDAQNNEMVAKIPATGGYRLQFGWVPAKKG